MLKQIDFLGVGDVTTDAFIEIIDAWIEDDNPERKKELCMRFGDKIPYKETVIVPGSGNSSNAVHAALKLGLKTALVTNIGDDMQGKEIINTLRSNGVDTQYVTVHKNKKSNYNYILRYKEERTILVHHNEYDYKFPDISPAPKWMYLSSLSKNSLSHHSEIAKYLASHRETKLAFQPGTFQIKLGKEKLADLYKLSHVFFCNKEEAEKIVGEKPDSVNETEYMKKLLDKLNALGPKIVVITDGPRGAFVLDSSGLNETGKIDYWKGPMYPDPAPPVDRTGAGDSFSSTFVVALAKGYPVEKALMWGPVNSASVVQYVGAQAGHLTETKLEEWLLKAPADYKPIKI